MAKSYNYDTTLGNVCWGCGSEATEITESEPSPSHMNLHRNVWSTFAHVIGRSQLHAELRDQTRQRPFGVTRDRAEGRHCVGGFRVTEDRTEGYRSAGGPHCRRHRVVDSVGSSFTGTQIIAKVKGLWWPPDCAVICYGRWTEVLRSL
jgi:hypothetical protein